MTNFLTLYFAYILEGLIAYFYFNTNYKQKVKPYVSMLTIQGLYFLAFVPNIIIHNNNVLINAITFALTTFLFAIICFEISVKSSIFHSILFLFIMVATEMVTEISAEFLLGDALFSMDNKLMNYFLGVVISKSLFFIVVYFVATIFSYKKTNAVSSMSKSYLNMLYPLTVLLLLGLVFRIAMGYELSHALLVATMILTSLATALCLLTAIYNQRLQKRENELAELERQQFKNEIDMQYLNLLENKNQQMRILAHDYKNHLAAIRELGKNDQVAEYIDKLTDEFKSTGSTCNSGNHTLDIIINKYSTECELKHIDFEYNTKLSNLSFVDDFDLVTILGNALDNALEAATASTEKKIVVSTKKVNTYDTIIISNSCDTVPDKNLKTSKKKGEHGLGLKSISKTIKKYGGDFEWEYNDSDKIFTITIMLQNPE